MNMFIPMSDDKVNENFLANLAKHFEMNYRNADNVIKKLKSMEVKSEKPKEAKREIK